MVFTLEKFLKRVSNMEKVLFFILMGDLIKANLTMTLKKERDINIFPMVLPIKEIFEMDTMREKEFFNGQMGKSMMVNG